VLGDISGVYKSPTPNATEPLIVKFLWVFLRRERGGCKGVPNDALNAPFEKFFVFDIEVELIWGFIDYRMNYLTTLKRIVPPVRRIIPKLFTILDRAEQPVTWGILGHCMLDKCQCVNGVPHPDMPRGSYSWLNRDWYAPDPCTSLEEDPAFYGKDIVDNIIDYVRESSVTHDIACHSFSHQIFGDPGCTKEVAEAEVKRCVELLRDNYGIKPEVFIFPRDSVGHLDILRKYNFIAFRGPPPGLPLVKLIIPPLVNPKIEKGLVNVPSSMCFGSRVLPIELLYIIGNTSILRSAKHKGILHISTHLINLVLWPSEKALRQLFKLLMMRKRRQIPTATISQIAKIVLAKKNDEGRQSRG